MKMSNNKMEGQNSSQYNSYKSLYRICQSIGLVLILCVFYWIVQFRGGFSFTEAKIIFNWHPLLMTIAFIYLLATAILHYRTFRNSKKQTLKNQHAIIHCCILILVLIAGYGALISHVYASPPIPNFYSLHSWIGIITIVLFLSQFISGLVSFLYPVISAEYREAVAPYHVFFGVLIFILAIVTAVLGFGEKLIFALDKDYKHFPAEGVFGNILGVLCIVYGGIVIYMVMKQEFKRNPQMEYESLP